MGQLGLDQLTDALVPELSPGVKMVCFCICTTMYSVIFLY